MNNQIIFIGWKSIGAACGVTWKTLKRYAIKYEMPVVPLNGRPSITGMELEIWWATLLLVKRGNKRKEKEND